MSKKQTVLGVHAPTSRILRPVIWRIALRYGLPFILFMFSLDLLIWWLARG